MEVVLGLIFLLLGHLDGTFHLSSSRCNSVYGQTTASSQCALLHATVCPRHRTEEAYSHRRSSVGPFSSPSTLLTLWLGSIPGAHDPHRASPALAVVRFNFVTSPFPLLIPAGTRFLPHCQFAFALLRVRYSHINRETTRSPATYGKVTRRKMANI